MLQAHPEYYKTWIEETPRGGRHVAYKMPVGVDIGSKTGKIPECPGLDIKAVGGYCIIWHPEDVKEAADLPDEYRQLLESHGFMDKPEDKAADPLPKSAPVSKTEGMTKGPDYWVEKYSREAHVGSRHDITPYLVRQLKSSEGLSERECEPYMRQYARNVDTAKDPYTEKEALDSLHYAYNNYPAVEPIIIPDPPVLMDATGNVVKPDPEKLKQLDELEQRAKAAQAQAKADRIKAEADREEKISADTWKPLTLEDAMKEQTTPDYVIEGIIELPSLTVIYGAPGEKKTWTAMDAALSIATGQPWLPGEDGEGGITAKRHPVMWIDQDMGPRRTIERFRLLSLGHGQHPNTNLTFYSMPYPPLDASKWPQMEKLKERILKAGSEVVFIDNLTTVNGGIEENNSAMAGVMTNLRRLAEDCKIALIVISHSRKEQKGENRVRSGDKLRGHSSIEAALDLALLVELHSTDRNIIKVRSTKTRGEDVQPITAHFWTLPDEDTGKSKAVRLYGMTASSEGKIGQRIIEGVIYDVLKREGPQNKGCLVSMVKGELERRDIGGKTGVTFIREILTGLENNPKFYIQDAGNGGKVYSATSDKAPSEKTPLYQTQEATCAK
jgi:hypothetical protein